MCIAGDFAVLATADGIYSETIWAIGAGLVVGVAGISVMRTEAVIHTPE